MTEDQKQQETILFMVESFNKDNSEMCLARGMTPEEADAAIESSQGNLNVLMTNLYLRMRESNLLA